MFIIIQKFDLIRSDQSIIEKINFLNKKLKQKFNGKAWKIDQSSPNRSLETMNFC